MAKPRVPKDGDTDLRFYVAGGERAVTPRLLTENEFRTYRKLLPLGNAFITLAWGFFCFGLGQKIDILNEPEPTQFAAAMTNLVFGGCMVLAVIFGGLGLYIWKDRAEAADLIEAEHIKPEGPEKRGQKKEG